MVINDFHVICLAAFPAEADAELVVDADAMLQEGSGVRFVSR
jgi:hypothetical protein